MIYAKSRRLWQVRSGTRCPLRSCEKISFPCFIFARPEADVLQNARDSFVQATVLRRCISMVSGTYHASFHVVFDWLARKDWLAHMTYIHKQKVRTYITAHTSALLYAYGNVNTQTNTHVCLSFSLSLYIYICTYIYIYIYIFIYIKVYIYI